MNRVLVILLVCLMVSCGKEQHDLTVKGHIKGLKKGTVYLKKVKDSALVNVDSLVISGNPNFELHSNLETPEVFFLFLDKNSKREDGISFFADKGITEINATLKNFAYDAKIIGSEQQKVLENYQTMIGKFNGRNLDLIKDKFEAQMAGDTSKLKVIQKQTESILKRRYLYTVNFALNNKDSEVAPYLALTEIYNAKISLLDTINVSLTEKVKASKYGKELQAFIDEIKASEKE
ncbi:MULTISPECIES: DUF4369 domain-containing protein [unclassified Algibacter]|uniref:DUF4369 domain-containing protein n=1 Tax=unclassified Algibacter TaxID=2615009 RepID=UPI00131D1380|nr:MULTISPECIES: DUF4369 domain-containing protein [unclassified Algibacter]MCL5129935.1 DUF4369 domain-containing protein [Algibacter sp. L4_22]